MVAEPERYACDTCEVRQRRAGLWLENAEALDLYQALAGPTVQAVSLQPYLFTRWMAGRSLEEVRAMLRRLDLVSEILSPDAEHGRPRPPHTDHR